MLTDTVGLNGTLLYLDAGQVYSRHCEQRPALMSAVVEARRLLWDALNGFTAKLSKNLLIQFIP